MDFPEDLGKRIVAAARLAVMLHVQREILEESTSGGTGNGIDGVETFGGAAMDGGVITPLSALQSAGALMGGKRLPAGGTAFGAAGGARAADREAA